MNLYQQALKIFYRIRMKFSKLTGAGIHTRLNTMNKTPIVSFYSLQAQTNSGRTISFEQYRGKLILLVNLASYCGYTDQYAELEKLHQSYSGKIEVLGFPSNDFGSQEPGSDEEIEQFCKVNYGVTFSLFKKDHVSGEQQQPVYAWLSKADQNGWNDKAPSWNFCKYLVNDEGVLLHYFSAAVSPLDERIVGELTASR
jgi:glutathione peroxidase